MYNPTRLDGHSLHMTPSHDLICADAFFAGACIRFRRLANGGRIQLRMSTQRPALIGQRVSAASASVSRKKLRALCNQLEEVEAPY
jgi:hypothetical protein